MAKSARIAGAHVLARDLAITAVDIDDGALSARLWNGAELHVVSGTRFLRCWFTRPLLGGYLNHSKTRTRYAGTISFSRLERRARALVPLSFESIRASFFLCRHLHPANVAGFQPGAVQNTREIDMPSKWTAFCLVPAV
jgi:hypothetical protein